MAVHLSELERLTAFARAITAPLAEAWTAIAGVPVRIDSPQAEELRAAELAGSLEGRFWVLPVEVTGVCGGSLAVLIDLSLATGGQGREGAGGAGGVEGFEGVEGAGDGVAGRLAGAVDDFLAGAGDRLTAAVGGSVSLDRLGLREAQSEQAAEILGEFLGEGDLVAVSFTVEVAGGGRAAGPRTGEVAVLFGTGLAREVGGRRPAGGDTLLIPPPPADRAAGRPAPVDRSAQVAPTERLARPVRPGPGVRPGAGRGAGPAPQTYRRGRPPAARGGALAPEAAPEAALIERVRGLRLRLSVDVGSRTVTVGDLLHLRAGSTIDLAKGVTEPLELLANGKRVALGDAVTLDAGPGRAGGFGLRVRAW